MLIIVQLPDVVSIKFFGTRCCNNDGGWPGVAGTRWTIRKSDVDPRKRSSFRRVGSDFYGGGDWHLESASQGEYDEIILEVRFAPSGTHRPPVRTGDLHE